MKNYMIKALAFFASILCFVTSMNAQEVDIINTYNRSNTSLNGTWKYIVDPYENGFYNYRYEPFDQQENPSASAFFLNSKSKSKSDLIEYDFDKSGDIQVPGDWNSQKERLYYYEGNVWYKKSFDYKKSKDNNRVFLRFRAVNYKADVYFNGKKLGTHLGGFTPFNYEISDLLKEEGNFVVVKVDNIRKKEGVPTLNTDWWNYGGITRDVELIETSSNFISDYFIQLNPDNLKEIKGTVQLNGENIAQKKVLVRIPELKKEVELVTDSNGMAFFTLKSKKISLWTNENPKLYEVIIKTEEEEVKDQIGFRSIRTSGINILLNNEKIFLKGICIHEENSLKQGRAHSKEDALRLLTMAKGLGCNYVRLAHYPHNEHMLRLADEMGILVWEEIPVYWTIQWENKETYKNAENQLISAVKRDKNRASVIIWSMANETPTSKARTLFLTNLANKTRSIDPTRLISAALERSNVEDEKNTLTIDDEFADVVDILSFNQYIGWYWGAPDLCLKTKWKFTQNKPVMISEFGAGAKYGYHDDKSVRWTEEYQEDLYTQTLKMIDDMPQVQGFSPWVLVDFRSPRRLLAQIQDGWNRKGLISDKGEKKKAYYVLQKYYQNK